MPQSRLVVETIASRGRGLANETTGSKSTAKVSMDSNSEYSSPRLKVIPDRLQGQAADSPDSEGDQRDDAQRAPAPRIKRLLGEARRHEAGDIDLLAVGGGAGAVQPFERVVVGVLGEFALVVERLERTDGARRRVSLGRGRVGDADDEAAALRLQRSYLRLQHHDRRRGVPHIAAQCRQPRVRADQVLLNPRGGIGARGGGFGGVDHALALAKGAD